MQLNFYHLAAKMIKENEEPHVKLQSHDQGHPRHHELLWDQRLLIFQRVGGLLTRLSAYCSVDHHSWSTNLSRALGMQHFLSLPFLQMHFRNLLWFQWPLTFLPQAENGPCKDCFIPLCQADFAWPQGLSPGPHAGSPLGWNKPKAPSQYVKTVSCWLFFSGVLIYRIRSRLHVLHSALDSVWDW